MKLLHVIETMIHKIIIFNKNMVEEYVKGNKYIEEQEDERCYEVIHLNSGSGESARNLSPSN